ncbi:hypothetical protein PAPHI01_1060 [Pancytospora philotis]|nr:hypothetical protein PAPHI01_1060 [Pancytospora philotis]
MELLEADVMHYSSDWNSGSLVYADSEGAIKRPLVPHAAFAPDRCKKDIKYYPPDDCVFTTTDPTGLRVWDASRNALLYAYKPDELSRHCYSQDLLATAFNDYNVNFYDLRCRYLASSMVAGSLVDVGWAQGYLYTYDGRTVGVYDPRRLAPVHTVERVVDFAIGGGCCFLLQKADAGRLLVSLSGPAPPVPVGSAGAVPFAAMTKKTKYERIVGLKTESAIAGLEGGCLKIESLDRIRVLPVPEKLRSLDAFYTAGELSYLFGNNGLYAISATNGD